MFTLHDADLLSRDGFTREEIAIIGEEYKGKESPDFEGETWTVARYTHAAVRDAYFSAYPGTSYRDYEEYIDNWRRTVGYGKDPWIWVDQFYFRKAAGAVTKKRWEDAYRKVQALKITLFID